MLGILDTCSDPFKVKFPLLVKLEKVRLNPFNVRVAVVALIVRVEIETAAVKIGMLVAVDTIKALSFVEIGTPVSQLLGTVQSVLVPPHQVLCTPEPPKSQFL